MCLHAGQTEVVPLVACAAILFKYDVCALGVHSVSLKGLQSYAGTIVSFSFVDVTADVAVAISEFCFVARATSMFLAALAMHLVVAWVHSKNVRFNCDGALVIFSTTEATIRPAVSWFDCVSGGRSCNMLVCDTESARSLAMLALALLVV